MTSRDMPPSFVPTMLRREDLRRKRRGITKLRPCWDRRGLMGRHRPLCDTSSKGFLIMLSIFLWP